MSILSGERRSVPSHSGQKPKAVRFQLAYNLKSLLLDFVTEKDRKLYDDLVSHIRDVGQEIRDDDLVQLLKEARGCVSILDGNFRLFVQVVLILKWTHRSKEVVSEYQGFLLDLCTAHNYYTKLVIDHLVTSFTSVTEPGEWEDCKPNKNEERSIQHIHQVIRAILNIIPMSQEILIASIIKNYPYLKKPSHDHESYVYNSLEVTNYAPTLRCEILTLITNKLISIDAHTSRQELEKGLKEYKTNDNTMEVDGVFEMEGASTNNSLAHSLDLCMVIMFRFVHAQCHGSDGRFVIDKAKSLYSHLVKIFENVILPTHAVHHVQFIIFYFLSFKPSLPVLFINLMWKKVTNPNIAPIIRQTSVSYIASLLARANYVPIGVVQDMLTKLSGWVQGYIDCADGSGLSYDPRVHGVFYANCQAMFYTIAFRYRELVNTDKGLAVLQSLNLSKVVTCRLNPLRCCQPAVVANFASVARAYQLAYCYTVVERNSRQQLPQAYRDSTGAIVSFTQATLDAFFPFDPYLLPRSEKFIDPVYREYCEQAEVDHHQVSTKDDDVDDFLDSHQSSPLTNFSYGTSPGFLQV